MSFVKFDFCTKVDESCERCHVVVSKRLHPDSFPKDWSGFISKRLHPDPFPKYIRKCQWWRRFPRYPGRWNGTGLCELVPTPYLFLPPVLLTAHLLHQQKDYGGSVATTLHLSNRKETWQYGTTIALAKKLRALPLSTTAKHKKPVHVRNQHHQHLFMGIGFRETDDAGYPFFIKDSLDNVPIHFLFSSRVCTTR